MAFDNHYPNRKDHRRPYRGYKWLRRQCHNHGGCPWCERGRQHATRRRMPVAEEDE